MAVVLEGLNPAQREAVRQTEGPLLILSGAGSGKTRVIAHRIAYLVGENGVPPSRIVALTFTNKAAGEMRERVERLVGGAIRSMWIGTFHSMCARILRREGHWIGYARNFAVYDTVDQQTLIKKIMESLEMPEDRFPLPVVRARISWAKNTYTDPMTALQGGDFLAQHVAKVYAMYHQALRANHAMDFDDLLINVVDLFQSYDGVLETYRDRFQYLLVDEYQDTNRIQYLLTKLLASKHRNVCVVGDDDQSIYGWRQADIRNILEFEQDYPDARVIRLEQNYRSTKTILEAAGAVVRHNRGRKEKALWTENEEGEPLVLMECPDERQEARAVVEMIQEERIHTPRSYGDVAVLYRTNAQSRAFEDRLRSAGIPYVIVGGVRFYERKEIKDILAYLRVIANPRDAVSLRRAIHVPRRGIGETTMGRVEALARESGMDLFEMLGQPEGIDGLNKAMAGRLRRFHALLCAFHEKRNAVPIGELAREVVTETGYWEALQRDRTVEGAARVENVNELFSAMTEFSERVEEPTLEGFLEEVSLITDVDQWSSGQDAVTLMTVHSAKGLEFPVVFITGLEDGLFPLLRPEEDAHSSGNTLEEERRLFYVGITRARERVFLSFARTRRRWGSSGEQIASRFLDEIPTRLIEPRRPMKPMDLERRRAASEFFHTGKRVADQLLEQRARDLEEVAGSLFTVGSWVIHSRFGRGQIVSKRGSGDGLMFVIVFDTGVKKKVMAKYAHLEPA